MVTKAKKSDIPGGELVTKPVDWIKPYWRNPRRVPEEAVNALVESIQRYGYQQPIVVDEAGVIIIGHTRYAAVRKLQVREIPVLIASHLSAKKVKELRVIDNRVAELTSWDLDALTDELEGLDAGLLGAFFPEMSLTMPGDEEGGSIIEDPSNTAWDQVVDTVDFVCPECFHSWTTKVTKDDIFKGRIES